MTLGTEMNLRIIGKRNCDPGGRSLCLAHTLANTEHINPVLEEERIKVCAVPT